MKGRIQRLYLVLLAFFFSLLRGNARKHGSFKKFVVICPTGNLGDMVCVTPIFCAIKRNIPEAEVTVVGSPINGKLLEGHPCVDSYIEMTQSPWTLVRLLRNKQFDAGIVTHLDAVNLATLFFANIKSISCLSLTSAYTSREPILYKYISHLVHRVPYSPGKYVPTQYIGLLYPFGILDSSEEKTLGYSHAAREELVKELKEIGIDEGDSIVAIAPGAGSPIKQWPPDKFGAVANYLYEKYRTPIVVIGGPHDTEAVNNMKQSLNTNVLFWIPGPQSMDMLKATLAHTKMVIGNDSGAIHIAEALGTMTLTVAGATDVAEHMRDDGKKHRIVKGNMDPHHLYRSYIDFEDVADIEKAKEGMQAVQVDDVIAVLDEIYRYNWN